MNPRAKQFVKQFRLVKRLVGARRAHDTRALGRWWKQLLAQVEQGRGDAPETLLSTTGGEPPSSSSSPTKVLLATSLGGWQPGTRLDSVLATALRLRGADVSAWLCDAALPACQLTDAYFYPQQTRFLRHGPAADMCGTCFAPAAQLFANVGVVVHPLSATLERAEMDAADTVARELPLDEIAAFELDGIAIGEHALSGALRFYARGDLVGEPQGEAVLREYLRAALRTFYSFRRLLAGERFDAVVLHHGIYVPQGTIAEICRDRGVRVATWHPAYRRNCFTFAEDDTYHRAMIVEPTSTWEQMDWSEDHEVAIMEYLQSRWQGSEDWISFNRDPEDNLRKISADLGLDPDKPWVGLLTTVMWDARLHYPSNAYPGVWEWVRDTIEYFAARPELQLIIRVHPAEVRGRLPARQLMSDEIAGAFPELPANVVVIPAASTISSYVVLANCDAALIYATKMGIELTATGIPTVVAGEAWIRGKGFSLDAGSPEQYRRILERLPLGERMPAEQISRARKYAFHYFFRRMIPLQFVHQGSNRSLAFDLKIDDLEELRPGHHLGLDVICAGILEGDDFIYPAERDIGRLRPGADEPDPHQAVL